MGVSEEERERRRKWALAAHQETVRDPETGVERRRFGGPQPRSGRPRKPRASEIIAEQVQAQAEGIRDALFDIAFNAKSAGERRRALTDLLSIEQREYENEKETERELRDMKRDELVQELLGLRDKQADMFEGEVTDEEDVHELEAGDDSEL